MNPFGSLVAQTLAAQEAAEQARANRPKPPPPQPVKRGQRAERVTRPYKYPRHTYDGMYASLKAGVSTRKVADLYNVSYSSVKSMCNRLRDGLPYVNPNGKFPEE